MKKIVLLVLIISLAAITSAYALPQYANSTTNPGVNCADCHNDGRVWVDPNPTQTPQVTPSTNYGQVTYDTMDNTLYLPNVQVDGVGYHATLTLAAVLPNLVFNVVDLDFSTSLDTVSAYYDSNTTQLMIPDTMVDGISYNVTLSLVPNILGIQFTVDDASSSDAVDNGAVTDGSNDDGAVTDGADDDGAVTDGADDNGAETDGADDNGAETDGADDNGAETGDAE